MEKPNHGGGWHAIAYTIQKAKETGTVPLIKAMSRKNACKTCALGMGGQQGGMRNEAGHFPEFCKKSLQAMAADMQPAVPDVIFENHSISELRTLPSLKLESLGRLIKPLYKSASSSHYKVIEWDEALGKISDKLKATEQKRSFFYLSGRSSNEAAFLMQLFCRIWGTNHVNNCSYYCHQASGVGLGASLGTGTATIQLDDLEQCDLLFIIGANPASNHPRLMTVCKDIRKRGGHVVVINPVKETGLQRFSVPSDPLSLLKPSEIASHYLQINPNGDMALFYALSKILIEEYNENLAKDFIQSQTNYYDQFKNNLNEYKLSDLGKYCGIEISEIRKIAKLYSRSKATVFSWAMGITHQTEGTNTVQSIANLALLRGMVGRKGAGLLPIRGHSNVQGIGSMGVKPEISLDQATALKRMGVVPPTHTGYDTMSCMEAAEAGNIDFALCLGGNLYGSNPDLGFAEKAIERIEMLVHLNTSLNTGHVNATAKEVLILPVAARDEESQSTTQESMFNYVRISDGGPPRFQGPRTETEIICDIAKDALADSARCPDEINFSNLKDHNNIRKLISETLKPFAEIDQRTIEKKEFYIPGRTLHTPLFPTPDGRANFHITNMSCYESITQDQESLCLLTIRSEGQFNTVVFEEEDRYRGQERRDVVMMNSDDIERLGFKDNDKVTIVGPGGTMGPILIRSFDIKKGAAMMYYPEANTLLDRTLDPRSKTPAFKGGRIKVTPFDNHKTKSSIPV